MTSTFRAGPEATILIYLNQNWDAATGSSYGVRRAKIEAMGRTMVEWATIICVNPGVHWLYRSYAGNGRLSKIGDNLFALTPLHYLPERLRRLRGLLALDRAIISAHLSVTVTQLNPSSRETINWLIGPLRSDCAGLANESFMVYECEDGYSAIEMASQEDRSLWVQREGALLRKAGVVFATSQTLADEKRRVHPNVHLLPNAADPAFYAQVQAADRDLISGIKHPVIGYLGTITRHLDLQLIQFIATARPEWTITIIGPEEDQEFCQSEAFQALRRLTNIKQLGFVPHDQLIGYCKMFDVGIIPYRGDAEFNKYVNPNKLHEYTAMGKPIVSTSLPCVESHRDLIYTADDPADFVSKIELAMLEDSPARIEERLKVARANSWDKRAAAIAQALQTHARLRALKIPS